MKKLIPKKIDIELIRLGEDNDGGYLVPNDLKGINKNYSAGVGFLTKFEKQLEKTLIYHQIYWILIKLIRKYCQKKENS